MPNWSPHSRHRSGARGTTLTFFEFNALAALVVFRNRGVQFAVLEVGWVVDRCRQYRRCGRGHRLFDRHGHMDWLGPDIESIAREKAGVFRSGQKVVLADPSMTPVVASEAARVGAHAQTGGRDYRYDSHGETWSLQMPGLTLEDLSLPALPGAIQLANAAASIALLQAMGLPRPLEVAHTSRAMRGLHLPGRFQIVPGPVEWILDVAHNAPAAGVLAANLVARPVKGRTLAVTGILGDKDIDAVGAGMAGGDEWILCGIRAPRGLSATALAQRSTVWSGATLAEDLRAGMHAAASLALPGDRIVVCGSFLTVAPALELLGLY